MLAAAWRREKRRERGQVTPFELAMEVSHAVRQAIALQSGGNFRERVSKPRVPSKTY